MAYLVSMDGPDQDTRFELATKGEMMLGRRTDNAIIIEGPAVSGHHCTLSIADGIYVVRDAGSTNGTRLNDEPVAEATMFRNDILTLGTTPLRLEGADVPERDDDPSDVGGVDRTRMDLRPRTTGSRAKVPRPKDFGKRQDHNQRWKLAIILIGIAVLGALVFFIKGMMNRAA